MSRRASEQRASAWRPACIYPALHVSPLNSTPSICVAPFSSFASQFFSLFRTRRSAHPYDYAEAAAFLENLDTRLEEKNPGASQLLVDQGIDLTEAAYLLSSVLPNIISTELLVSGSRNVISAQLQDVVACMETCKPLRVDVAGKGAWLEKRKRRTQSARNIFEHGKGGPAAAAASGAESGAADAEDTEGTAAQAINQEFKVAVGYSSAEDPKRAATESYRQLRTKLSNATPHAVIVAMSGIYDFPTVVSTLRDLLPATTPMIAGTIGTGIIVDGQYLDENGRYLALQGIHGKMDTRTGGISMLRSFDTRHTFLSLVPS